jgi:hypothetical protein
MVYGIKALEYGMEVLVYDIKALEYGIAVLLYSIKALVYGIGALVYRRDIKALVSVHWYMIQKRWYLPTAIIWYKYTGICSPILRYNLMLVYYYLLG